MNFELAIATVAGVFLVGGIAGLAIRFGAKPEPADRPPPPAPPEYFRARINPPLLSTYDGAARLQRARRAASDFIAEIGSTNEILPGDQSGIPRTGPRPFGPIDVDAMTRAIVTAWIGEDEPMVSVPIMKLGDIKLERNEAGIQGAVEKIAEIDKERQRRGLPPLAGGGLVERGKPYIVGERPGEQTRPLSEHPDQGDA